MMSKSYKEMSASELRAMFRGELPEQNRTRDVTVPDGTEEGFTFTGVPDDVTDEQVLEHALKTGKTKYENVIAYPNLVDLPFVKKYNPVALEEKVYEDYANSEDAGASDKAFNTIRKANRAIDQYLAGKPSDSDYLSEDDTLGTVLLNHIGPQGRSFLAGTKKGVSDILSGSAGLVSNLAGVDDYTRGPLREFDSRSKSTYEYNPNVLEYPMTGVAGQVVPYLAGARPSFRGNVGVGALYGGVQPVEDNSPLERTKNIMFGGGFSGGVHAAIAGLSKTVSGFGGFIKDTKSRDYGTSPMAAATTSIAARATNTVEDVLDSVLPDFMRPNKPLTDVVKTSPSLGRELNAKLKTEFDEEVLPKILPEIEDRVSKEIGSVYGFNEQKTIELADKYLDAGSNGSIMGMYDKLPESGAHLTKGRMFKNISNPSNEDLVKSNYISKELEGARDKWVGDKFEKTTGLKRNYIEEAPGTAEAGISLLAGLYGGAPAVTTAQAIRALGSRVPKEYMYILNPEYTRGLKKAVKGEIPSSTDDITGLANALKNLNFGETLQTVLIDAAKGSPRSVTKQAKGVLYNKLADALVGGKVTGIQAKRAQLRLDDLANEEDMVDFLLNASEKGSVVKNPMMKLLEMSEGRVPRAVPERAEILIPLTTGATFENKKAD